jgi:RNA polymerase sigma-70 factor (ECF subfamily)
VSALPDNSKIETLLRRCAAKDESALKTLYDETAPFLLGVMMRILHRRDLAEDALQDVLVKVWQQAHQFDQIKGRATAWVTSIARYRAIDMHRSRRQTIPLGDDDSLLDERWTNTGDEDSGFAMDSPIALQKCLELLGVPQKNCVLLAYREGLSQNEISKRIGEPLGTVKSWVRRSLQSLKRCLES